MGQNWTCFLGRVNNSFSHSSAVGVWPGQLKGSSSSWTGHILYSTDDWGIRKMVGKIVRQKRGRKADRQGDSRCCVVAGPTDASFISSITLFCACSLMIMAYVIRREYCRDFGTHPQTVCLSRHLGPTQRERLNTNIHFLTLAHWFKCCGCQY